MGTMKEFKTQICTTIEQSKRLLDLGLKPETADCTWAIINGEPVLFTGQTKIDCNKITINGNEIKKKEIIHHPAWSLHRLIFMCPQKIHIYDDYYNFSITRNWVLYRSSSVLHGILFSSMKVDLFDAIIEIIGYLIKANHFDKEYLKQ